MERFMIFLLVPLGFVTFLGCGKASSAPKPPTAEQERRIQEQLQKVADEESKQQELARRKTQR